jgi:hypothetical protein
MEGREIATDELIIMLGAARASRARPRFSDLAIGVLIVVLALGGLAM